MAQLTVLMGNEPERKLTAPAGACLLDLLKEADIPVDAPCNGNGTCGKCKVRVRQGDLNRTPSRHITDRDQAEGWCLACQSQISEDVTVEIPVSAAAFRSDIRTADLSQDKTQVLFQQAMEALRKEGMLDRAPITLLPLSLEEPTLDDTMPDSERLERGIKAHYGKETDLTLPALLKLAPVARENHFQLQLVTEENGDKLRILDLFPAGQEVVVAGVAIDIGTTTVTAVLVDLQTGAILAKASAGNGQIPYGADVINRIVESAKEGGSTRLQKAVVDHTVQPMLETLCKEAGLPLSHIYRMVVAGNTTMEHLLLGLYADPIRMEPFVPTFYFLDNYPAGNLFRGINTAAHLNLSPNIGSYVGGDITAGAFASNLWIKEEMTLFVDLGTNGELVVGNNEFQLACACSAGPAFEGGDISCGMRATTGAIEAISVDAETLEPTMSIIGEPGTKPVGLCGSGLLDLIASLFKGHVIDARGKYCKEGDRILHDHYGMGRYVIATAEESGSHQEISLSEVDIDNFIRAKGAIFSGINTLLGQVGMTPADVSSVLVAGGIGGGIDFENAVTIGMLPDIDRSLFHFIGNTSLTGAYAMLVSDKAKEKTAELARGMMYVELSAEPGYMDEFIAACFLPHTNRTLFPSIEV